MLLRLDRSSEWKKCPNSATTQIQANAYIQYGSYDKSATFTLVVFTQTAPPLLLLSKIRLTLWLFMACISMGYTVPKGTALPDIRESLEEALTTFLKKKDVSIQSFNVTGNTAEGTLQLFGAAATFVLEYSDESHFKTFTVKFNRPIQFDRSDSKRLTGENLDNWWPKGFPEPGASTVIFEFENSIIISSLKILMEGGNWSPVSGSPLQINSPQFTVTVRAPASKRPSISIMLNGNLNVGGTTAAIATSIGSSGQDWAFNGKIPSVVLGQALQSVLNDPLLNEIPQEISAIGLRDVEFSVLPKAQQFSARGLSDLGQLEFEVKPAPNRGPLGLLLGFKPPSGFQLSKIASGLRPLDNMGLQNTTFILSSVAQPASLKILPGMAEVRRGLTMRAGYDLNELSREFASWLKVSTLNIESTVSNQMSDVMLQGSINTSIPFDQSGNVTMREINMSIRPAPALKVDMGAFIDIKTSNGVVLQFRSAINVDIPNLAIGVSGVLNGVWENPFGISPGLTISDLGLGINASIKGGPIPLPALALKGTMKAGNPPVFSGAITVGLNSYDPLSSMVDAHFDRLSLGQIARGFAPGIPLNDIIQTLDRASLSNVQVTVVPNPNGVVILDKTYAPGFLVKGSANILDYNLELLVRIEQAGMEARAAMDAIRHAPFFSLTSADGSTGPSLDFRVKPGDVRMALTGAATVLGLTRSAEMYIRDSGFELMTGGKIFNMFNATLRVYGSAVRDGASFGINAKLENDIFDYITKNATAEIDKATKDTQNGINGAKHTITVEQEKLNSINANIVQQRAIVQAERDRDCNRLRTAEADVENKRREVERIQNDINAQHREIAEIDKRIAAKSNWVESAPDFVQKSARGLEAGPFYAEQALLRSKAMALIGTFESGKAIANAALIAAREIMGGMAYLCAQTPIDVDPRVAGLFSVKAVSQGAMEAAKQILEGAKIVSVGSFQAGKWIVENGSPAGVINITYAEFDGNLSAVTGGQVSLKVKGIFAGNPLDTSFTFDFNNPIETINAFADSLVK